MTETPAKPFDLDAVRRDFPILAEPQAGRPIVYFDNGATTQKPAAVLRATDHFYSSQNANIHRAVHQLAQRATDAYEAVRVKVQRFLHAPAKEEIIFTRGTTESINLVAFSLSQILLKPGDEILISTLEHHSNIVPWQLAAERHGATIKVISITDAGDIDYDAIPSLLSTKTKIVAFTQLSNALGTIVDAKRIIDLAKTVGAKTVVDGAQWVGHFPTDVQSLGCDFYAFSGHKLFGPTGVGVLWGRRELLDAMPPFLGGGDMIRTVSFEQSTWADVPAKFEAGTPNIAGVVGLGAAIDYLNALDIVGRAEHEHQLLEHATKKLAAIDGVRIIGTAGRKASIVSFVLENPAVDHHTLATLLDGEGIAVRSGHHCCMPLMNRLGVAGTVRASMAFYNTIEEVDRLVEAVLKIRDSFAGATPKSPAPAGETPYAAASASSPKEAADALIEDFDLFDDWEQKHEYLIDLGKKLPPLPESEKIETNRVHGCQSTVYLTARRKPGSDDVLEFAAESDAFIVNGLIYLLQAVYSGQRVSEILAFDVDAFFDRLGLKHHLSMGRRNGLASMVERIRTLARLIDDSRRKEGAA